MPRTRHEKRYRKVFSEIYADDKFGELTPMQPSGQALFLYLLTGPHCTNLPGLIVSGRAGLAEALGWTLEDFDRCFAEVERRGMALADWKRRVVWLPNAIRHNRPDNQKVVRGWQAAWREVPQCEMKDRAARAILSDLRAHADETNGSHAMADEFARLSGLDSETVSATVYETVSDTRDSKRGSSGSCFGGNQEQDQEQDQETYIDNPDDVPPGRPAAAPARVSKAHALDPARRAHQLDEPPTTRLSAESLAALEEFATLYPRKDTPRRLLHTVWLEVCPTPAQGRRVVEDLRARLARGWPGDTPATRLKTMANWLREEHFTTPLPTPAASPPSSPPIEGRSVTGECADCGGFIRGVVRDGAPVFEPCATCTQKAKAS